MQSSVRPTPFAQATSRKAVVVLELILSLPILMIFIGAVIEFGLILANMKQVKLASRTAAKVAAETDGLNPATTSAVVANLRTIVDNQLETAGFNHTRRHQEQQEANYQW